MGLEILSRGVLICDDDPAMVRIFQFLLRQHGIHTLITANKGENVVSLVKQHKPMLILLDLMLPGKDGISVLKELKADEATRAIPVIVVSGKESHQQVQAAMIAGAIDYVVKPFEPAELGVRIKNFMDGLIDSTLSGPKAPPAAAPAAEPEPAAATPPPVAAPPAAAAPPPVNGPGEAASGGPH